MDERRICLAGGDALRMLRYARRSDGLTLVPAGGRALRDAEERIDPEVLLAVLPGEVFEPSARPVLLRFDDAPARSRCSLVRARSGLRRVPDAGFLEVRTRSGNPLGPLRGTVAHVFVESPGLAPASAGAVLAAETASGRVSRNSALVRLVGLAMELCGIYARDPVSPLAGTVAHDLEPIGRVADACALLSALHGWRGVARARHALSLANDGSGSVMETLWYALFCLPPRLGGVHLERPLQNEALVWPRGVPELASHELMRPDFYWPRYRTACEYQGGDHADEASLAEDSRRARDYELCDIHYLPLTKRDSLKEPDVRAVLSQLFEVIAPYEGAAFRRKAQRLLNDPAVRAARRVLMGQLLPPQMRW